LLLLLFLSHHPEDVLHLVSLVIKRERKCN
jgi:hypothetical protein